MLYLIEISRLRPAGNSFNLFRINFDAVFAHNVAQIRQFSLAPSAFRHFDQYRALAQYVHDNLDMLNMLFSIFY